MAKTKAVLVSSPEATKRQDFVLKFEVAIIEHLGLNLYSEVHSAISELIANAYDADASKVTVSLPVGEVLGRHDQTIIISDNGHGMTYEDARDLFLSIGRNRRKSGAAKSKIHKRKVIGKKGIGKLAGFGIADRITVRSVAPSAWKDDKPVDQPNLLTEFVMDLDEIRKAPLALPDDVKAVKNPEAPDLTRNYQPDIIYANTETDEPIGTTIILDKLRQLDEIDLDDFTTLLTRKFAIFDSKFTVVIKPEGGKEKELSRFDLECPIRFPERTGGPYRDGWLVDAVKVPRMGNQTIRYWIGFTERPIRRDAERGVSILAGGKQVQEPFEFKMAGGAFGQFGLQYLTGQVEADWLDDENQATDIIASDRSSVRWSDPRAAVLLKWGQAKLKELMSEWISQRAQKTVDVIKVDFPEIEKEIASYRGAAQEELRLVVDRIATELADVDKERRVDVIRSVVTAYRHQHIQDVLGSIIKLPGTTSIAGFAAALKEWDLLDAVLTFQELTSKAEVLLAFATLIHGGATEVKSAKGDLSLHELLSEHPWLIDPSFGEMHSELNVDEYLFKNFKYDPAATTGRNPDLKRADFIAVYRDGDLKMIEIKSAKDPIDERGLRNLTIYHKRAKDAVGKSKAGDGETWRVRSMLIYNGEVSNDEAAKAMFASIEENKEYQIFVWTDLLRRNTLIYKEMLERVRLRNPTDPRIVDLYKNYMKRLGAANSSVDRAEAKKAVRKAVKAAAVPVSPPVAAPKAKGPSNTK